MLCFGCTLVTRPGHQYVTRRFVVFAGRRHLLIRLEHRDVKSTYRSARPQVRPRPHPSAFQRQAVSVRVLKIFRFEDGADV
jgi:hypothetical protein